MLYLPRRMAVHIKWSSVIQCNRHAIGVSLWYLYEGGSHRRSL